MQGQDTYIQYEELMQDIDSYDDNCTKMKTGQKASIQLEGTNNSQLSEYRQIYTIVNQENES